MAELTAHEQLLIELVNRARLDPAGEAARYGIDLNDGLAAGTITAAPKQPLAPNPNLATAAQGHSQWMLDNDVFSHTGAGGSDPEDRMRGAGYAFTGWFWYLGTLVPVIGVVQVGSQAMADRYTYVPFVGLFVIVAWGAFDAAWHLGPGHRVFLVSSAFLALLACAVGTWFQ